MKAIVCEMCGSHDVIKQDGYYICQSCGTKYTAEEAKKLLVEGTVKIDNTNRLASLYIAARQAKNINDNANAAKHYSLILAEDPQSWEANFYNVYYAALDTRVMNIASTASSLAYCVEHVFGLLKMQISDMSERKKAIEEISLKTINICKVMESSARSALKSTTENTLGKFNGAGDFCMKNFEEYASRVREIEIALVALGDMIEKDYRSDSSVMAYALTAWKQAIQYLTDSYLMFDSYLNNKSVIEQNFCSKVKRYEPAYVMPAPNMNGFPSFMTQIMQRRNGTGTGGGCYVATCVYGSYDCPPVWTLRRFRDRVLASSWYGRLFVKLYYGVSPSLVKWFGQMAWFRKIWRAVLDRMVTKLQTQGMESSPYIDKIW